MNSGLNDSGPQKIKKSQSQITNMAVSGQLALSETINFFNFLTRLGIDMALIASFSANE